MIRGADKAQGNVGGYSAADAAGIIASKRKVINALNLSTVSTSSYSEVNTGPLKPGFYFYNLLIGKRGEHNHGSSSNSIRGPPLRVPIAETLVVDGPRMVLLHNDAKGNVVRSKPPRKNGSSGMNAVVVDAQRREFLMDVVRRFADGGRKEAASGAAADATETPAHASSLSFAKRIPLLRRPAAVLKRPAWRNHVASDTEILLPIPLAANIDEDLRGHSNPHVIQRYIRSRGKKACFYRVFWNPATPTSPKSVNVWNISSEDNIVDVTPDVANRFFNPDLAYGPDECLDIVSSMAQVGRSLERARAEPTALLYAGRFMHGEVGSTYLCGLAGPDGSASDELCMRRSTSRVVGRAVGELEAHVDRLAAWFEATTAAQFQLPVRLSELVVDFIRDEDDHWYMIQVKGFKLSPESKDQVHQWRLRREELKAREEQEENYIGTSAGAGATNNPGGGMPGGIATSNNRSTTNTGTSASRAMLPVSGEAMRQQLEEAGGVHCRLCGMSFTEGQMVRVKLSASKQLGAQGVDDVMAEGEDDTITHEVPCYGYQLSMSMACKLAEIYRDAGYPLTLVARDILLDYADILAVPKRGASTALHRPTTTTSTSNSNGRNSSSNPDLQPMGLANRTSQGAAATSTTANNNTTTTNTATSATNHGVTVSTTSNALSSIRKKRAGWVVTCHLCFQILEEQQRHETASVRLFSALGLGHNQHNINTTSSSGTNTSNTTTTMRNSTGGGDVNNNANTSNNSYRMMLSSNSASSSRTASAALGADTNNRNTTTSTSSSNSSSNVVLSETCMRMGQPAPWTVHEFGGDVGQFRMLVMAQYIVDMKPTVENARLVENVACRLAYNIGKYQVQLPFMSTPESGSYEDKLVFVKQCRLHYFFASRRAAAQLFDSKRINFNLYVNRRDALNNELQYEGSGSINLQSVRWEAEEIEKVDVLMPVSTHSFGTIYVKLSVAVDFSAQLPWQAINEHFAREKDVYWPCSAGYQDGAPLPALWVDGMLAIGRGGSQARSGTSTNTSSRDKFKSAGAGTSAGTSTSRLGGDTARSDPNLSTSGGRPSSRQRSSRKSSGGSSAISTMDVQTDATTTTDYPTTATTTTSNSNSTNTSSTSTSTSGAPLDIAKFDAISSLMPFVSHVFDRQRMSADGKTQIIPAIHAIIYALEACVLDPSLLNKPFRGTDEELATLSLSADTAQSLIDALKEMAADDVQPSDRMAWHEFLDALSGYVGVVLKRERQEAMVRAASSRFKTTNASGAETSSVPSASSSSGGNHASSSSSAMGGSSSAAGAGTSASTSGISGGDGAIMMNTRRGIRLAKILTDLSLRLKGTSIDVLSNPAETLHATESRLHKIAEVDPTALPVSRHRKLRRLMYVLAIFEHVSQRSDVADAAELKLYMESERNSLSEALVLVKNGMLSIPTVTHNFEVDLGSEFSLPRAVICTQLLSSSDKLQQLFDRYTSHGVAVLSHVGFLKTCEECFQYVSSGRSAIKDPVLVELRVLADKAHKQKYKPDVRDAVMAAAHGFLPLSSSSTSNSGTSTNGGAVSSSTSGKAPLVRRHTTLTSNNSNKDKDTGSKTTARPAPASTTTNNNSSTSNSTTYATSTSDIRNNAYRIEEGEEEEEEEEEDTFDVDKPIGRGTSTTSTSTSSVKAKTAEDFVAAPRRGSNVHSVGGVRKALDAESVIDTTTSSTIDGITSTSNGISTSGVISMNTSPKALNKSLAVAKSLGSSGTATATTCSSAGKPLSNANSSTSSSTTVQQQSSTTNAATGSSSSSGGGKGKAEVIAELKAFAQQLNSSIKGGSSSTSTSSPSRSKANASKTPTSTTTSTSPSRQSRAASMRFINNNAPIGSPKRNANNKSTNDSTSNSGGGNSRVPFAAAAAVSEGDDEEEEADGGVNAHSTSAATTSTGGSISPSRPKPQRPAPSTSTSTSTSASLLLPLPPMLVCSCEAHGDELFFLADLLCSACEREQWRAITSSTSTSTSYSSGGTRSNKT